MNNGYCYFGFSHGKNPPRKRPTTTLAPLSRCCGHEATPGRNGDEGGGGRAFQIKGGAALFSMAGCWGSFLSRLAQGAPHTGEGDDSVAGPEQRPRRAPSRARALFLSAAIVVVQRRGGQRGGGGEGGERGKAQAGQPASQPASRGTGGLPRQWGTGSQLSGLLTHACLRQSRSAPLSCATRLGHAFAHRLPLRLLLLLLLLLFPPFSVAATGRRQNNIRLPRRTPHAMGPWPQLALQGSAPGMHACTNGSRQEASSEPSPWQGGGEYVVLSLAQSPFQPASPEGSAGGGAWDCRGFLPFSPQGCAHPGSNSALPAKRGRGEKNRKGLSRREGKAAKGGRHSETIPNVKRGAVACVKGRTTADTGGGGTGTGYPGGPRSASWREPATFAVPGSGEGGKFGGRVDRPTDRRPSLPRALTGRTDGRSPNPQKTPPHTHRT